MARYLGDQNSVAMLYESGLYSSTLVGSSVWIGQVISHSFDSDEGFIESKYLGTTTRNFDRFDNGPRAYTGTLEYHPQDMRLMFYSIGSIFSISGTQSRHLVTEIDSDAIQSGFTSGTLNPPLSFTLEDSKQSPGTGRNFVRTIRGCIPNTTTLSLTQGEKATISIDYIAQVQAVSSGGVTSLTETTTRPYLWSDTQFQIGIGAVGSVLQTPKAIEFIVNQNRVGPHYLTGSREISAPFNGNRDYTVNVTMDLDGTEADMLYNTFFRGGSSFNAQLDLNGDVATVGSKHVQFYMSGCRIISMDNPSEIEGVTETTIEIRPQTINAQEWAGSIVSGLFGPYA